MSNRDTQLTVLMSVRNGEPYVRESVQSILRQTYEDYLFLIVDNASDDRTPEIVESFRDPRVRLIQLEKDIGQTAALNLGLGMTRSPYIARIDADDVSHPTRLEKQMAYARAHPDTALIGTWTTIIGPDGSPIAEKETSTDPDVLMEALLFRNVFAHSSVMFARAAVSELGGYPTHARYAQDYALWLEVTLRHPTAILPQFLVSIRRHDEQVGRSGLSSERVRDPMVLIDNILSRPDLPSSLLNLKNKARARASLRYAAGLREEGRWSQAFVELGRGLMLDAPGLLGKESAVYIAQTVLGMRGYEWICSARRRRPMGT